MVAGARKGKSSAVKPEPKGSKAAPSQAVKPVQAFCPSLKLSREFREFRLAANRLAEVLKPLDMSISSVCKSVAAYRATGKSFAIEKELGEAFNAFTEAKAKWDTWKDSFRASRDAEVLPIDLSTISLE